MERITTLVLSLVILAVAAVGVAIAAEPNDDFATAEGPLTAGKVFKGSLETEADTDFHFFYLPDTTTVSVTTFNDAAKGSKAQDRGRTIVSSLLRGRKGKLPQPVLETQRELAPKDKATVRVSLLPGKYFIPVGHALDTANPLGDVPFRLRIGPVGSTTDSFEIFAQRCAAAKRRVDRVRSSIERTSERIAKAKKNDAPTKKIVNLKLKLKDKRAKAKELKKAEKFACSIPQ
jgi:hypothetical protein